MKSLAKQTRRPSAPNADIANAPRAEAVRKSLFLYFARTKDRAVRDQLVFEYMAMVRHIAMRFAKRLDSLEDLVQVGTIGLLKAIDRFEPERGFDFSSYAVPTIVGEIKRYFRDKSWAMRVPRRLKDLNVAVGRAMDEMTVELGRPVTHADLAARLGVSVDDIVEAQEMSRAYVLQSLDAELTGGDRVHPETIGDRAGGEDPDLARLLDRTCLENVCGDLDRRERAIVYLRFFENLSQSEIGRRLGCTQMHVSRMQRRALEKMRRAGIPASSEF